MSRGCGYPASFLHGGDGEEGWAAAMTNGDEGALPDRDPLVERIVTSSPALTEVRQRLLAEQVLHVGRCGEGAVGLLLAHLSEQLDRPLVVICSSPDAAERLRSDTTTFTAEPIGSFGMWESLFEEDSEPDPETFRERFETVRDFQAGKVRTIIAPVQAVLQPFSTETGEDHRVVLRCGDLRAPAELARSLVNAGYRRFPQVSRPGDFAIRGGIFDVWPREESIPYRIDFFDDEIESIQSISQRDGRVSSNLELLVLTIAPKEAWFIRGWTGREQLLFDVMPKNSVVAVWDPREVEQKAHFLVGQWASRQRDQLCESFWARAGRFLRLQMDPLVPEPGHRPVRLPVVSAERFQGSFEATLAALADETDRGADVLVFLRQEAEAERFREVLEEGSISSRVRVRLGGLSCGFRWEEPGGGIFVSGNAALGRKRSLERVQKKRVEGRAVDTFLELEEGQHVVHVTHGIARYCGLRNIREGTRQGDFLVLEFAEGVTLLVPVERIDLVQKFVGGGKKPGRLDRIGGTAWSKKKGRAEEALHDLASELLEIQALRAERPGYQFPEDDDAQHAFEESFPFEETGDQLETVGAIKQDMELPKPMDRLVCGDVGYGKTELAMRAAFKVVRDGKQVAVLVPTTVLAQQHLVTFRERMAEWPVKVEVLSRFLSRKEQGETLERTARGDVDILIGTHRLLSGDVNFPDLGLIVIDEEQRFGVAHKEKLKQLRRLVDVLTLTATPIPRTLHMSLVGVKDISSLHEAPEGRAPIQTEVCSFDDKRFRQIVLRELNRDGQVYWLHNRVTSIDECCQRVEKLLPEAAVVVAHGQMNEHELEARMIRFIDKQANILVSTTIIESGLDIPSANTLIVERADRFGLSQLHQLRGRVGRSHHKAYCYLLIPEDQPLKMDSRRRLEAIEEYSQLGAGFQIAMRDLEIRGAGNILGKEQSGHIGAVGYDLFCRLLERAVADLRGVPWQEPPDVEIALRGLCRIPEQYISDTRQRLRNYRSIATALRQTELDVITEDLLDRHGPLPSETARLVGQQRLRIRLGGWGVKRIIPEEGWLVMEGDRDAIREGIQGLGWQAMDLPDGTIAGRPKGGTAPIDLDGILEVLNYQPSAGV
ncbi:MAG TPA: transcription-repair coupling factor [Planctomycetes bacterium]|nr:transcription-repair coupling factor [Planctomycetota bacterium]